MIRGITFDKQLMSSADHAHEVNYYFGGDMGVTKGCTVTENVDGDLAVTEGYFLIKGRLVNVVGTEIVAVPSVPSGTMYSILVFEIDLTQVNTTSAFNQGEFKIVSNASAYPTLIQQDLDNGGDVYQFEFVRFENSVSGIANLTDTRVLLDLTKYASKSSEVNKSLLASGWVGASAPYTYALSVSEVTLTSNQELLPSLTITDAELRALQSANIIDAGQSAGVINLKAFGNKPTIDLPIRVILRGDA